MSEFHKRALEKLVTLWVTPGTWTGGPRGSNKERKERRGRVYFQQEKKR